MVQSFSSRYSIGDNVIKHKGASVRTTLNSGFEDIYSLTPKDTNFELAKCIQAVEHRPDTISYLFYKTPSYWWYLQAFNGISDPFEGFNIGDRLLIPNVQV